MFQAARAQLAMTLSVRVLVALIAALAVGLSVSFTGSPGLLSFVSATEPIGALWVNAIRMTVVPLVVALLITGIASGSARSVGRLGGTAVLWFVVLAVGAATIAATLAPPLLALVQFDTSAVAGMTLDTPEQVTLPPFRDWLLALIPANPIRAATDGAMLPLIVFTGMFALAITRLAREQREHLIGFFKAVGNAMLVIVDWILAVAPIGVFFLVAPLAARSGLSLVGAFGYFIVVASGLVVVALIALYPITAVFGGTSLMRFARACIPVQAVGFSTRSSLASLPAMLEAAERDLQLPERVTGMTLPVAVAVFKFSSPTVRLTGTLFVAQLYGISLSAPDVIALAGAVTLLSFYSPGIPSGGLFILAPIFVAFNLPLDGIGLLIALDLVPDMFITTANVTADMSVATILAQRETDDEHPALVPTPSPQGAAREPTA